MSAEHVTSSIDSSVLRSCDMLHVHSPNQSYKPKYCMNIRNADGITILN